MTGGERPWLLSIATLCLVLGACTDGADSSEDAPTDGSPASTKSRAPEAPS